jgi:hypothetical protein
MDQVSIKYTNIFKCKTLQNLPKFGFLVCKQTIWQPWSREIIASFAALSHPLPPPLPLELTAAKSSRRPFVISAFKQATS